MFKWYKLNIRGLQTNYIMKWNTYKRIRSVPGNNVRLVSNSAIIQPTDQISTA